MMNGTTRAAMNDLALLKPQQSLQNVGEKKDDDDEKRGDPGFQAFGADGFTFLDLLDIVNPLQHIPIVSTLYREITGDQIDPGSRIAGGTLFGGPIGTVLASVNVALNESTGKDMGDHIMAYLSGEPEENTGVVELANGPEEPEIPDQTSPITTNLEVLEWAQREAALMAGPVEPPGRQVAESGVIAKKAIPGTVTQARLEPYQIATNVDVRDWARNEARLSGKASPENVQVRDQQQSASLEGARQKKVASGQTQQQLIGATAPSGGWFTETMLLALASYQESAGLGKAPTASGKIGAAAFRPDE